MTNNLKNLVGVDKEDDDKEDEDKHDDDKENGDKEDDNKEDGNKEDGNKEDGNKEDDDKEDDDKEDGDKENNDKTEDYIKNETLVRSQENVLRVYWNRLNLPQVVLEYIVTTCRHQFQKQILLQHE